MRDIDRADGNGDHMTRRGIYDQIKAALQDLIAPELQAIREVRVVILSVLGVVLACSVAVGLAGAQVIVNGGFESGFTGWTIVDQPGSGGTFHLQTGTMTPVNGDPVPAPPQGSFAAMTDVQGPGSHILYQDIVIPSAVPTAMLSFQLFIANGAGMFVTADTLDFGTPALNQQARVDIFTASSDPFSVDPADVLATLYQTRPGDPLVSGYTPLTFDITTLVNTHLNTPLRLRFAEVDNVFIFNLGLDDVRLDTGSQAVPEPATWSLLGVAGAALIWWRRGTPSRSRYFPCTFRITSRYSVQCASFSASEPPDSAITRAAMSSTQPALRR